LRGRSTEIVPQDLKGNTGMPGGVCMGRIIAFFVMIMLVAPWCNAQDDISLAEKLKREGEEISEPIKLTDGSVSYTVYFYEKDSAIVGAIVLQDGKIVKDAEVYVRIVNYALQFRENDFVGLYSSIDVLTKKLVEVEKRIDGFEENKDLEEAFDIIESVLKIDLGDLLKQFKSLMKNMTTSAKQFKDNWIFTNMLLLKGVTENNIQSLEFLNKNKEKIDASLGELDSIFKKFNNYDKELLKVTMDIMSKIIPVFSEMSSDKFMSFIFDIDKLEEAAEERKQEINKSIKEFESQISQLRKKITSFTTYEEQSNTLAVDFFEKRVPPKLVVDITLPTQETQGNPISVSVKIKNEGMTEARNVKLSVILDITQKSESIEKLQAGEEKELQYTFETKEMKSGTKKLAVNIDYEGIRGTFSLSEEKEMLLKYNYMPIVIGGGIVVVLIVAGILVIRMKKKTVKIKEPIKPPLESAESPPSEP
jgi:DNA-binding protein H-NS